MLRIGREFGLLLRARTSWRLAAGFLLVPSAELF